MPKKTNEPSAMPPQWVILAEMVALRSLHLVPEELGIDLTTDLHEKYSQLIRLYLYDKSSGEQPGLSVVRKNLNTLQQASQAFIDALKMFDHPTAGRLLMIQGDHPTAKQNAISMVKIIKNSSRRSRLALAHQKGKRSRKEALYNLVLGLAEIYCEATGEQPTGFNSEDPKQTTQFVRFVSKSLNHIGYSQPADISLGKQINRIFEKSGFLCS